MVQIMTDVMADSQTVTKKKFNRTSDLTSPSKHSLLQYIHSANCKYFRTRSVSISKLQIF